MLIKRLYLRNFRVYEDELDLDLPPGLVGIYGPNGSGKSTLLEAVLFTLWGKSRTTKDQIRSSGVGGDCVTEVEFEHEGHLYLVRRVLKGVNSAVTVEAHCDGALMSTGTRDAERYVESVLGMDDGAFRASVFTEQKQLAAFSDQSPAERRRLVLQLLGITPLDGARDAARKDARDLTANHDRLRGMLADLGVLATDADDSTARADAAARAAAEESGAAEVAGERAAAAVAAFGLLDQRRQEHDALVLEGRAVRQEAGLTKQTVTRLEGELGELDGLARRLAGLEQTAAGLAADERRAELLVGAASAAARVAQISVPPRPPGVDEAALEQLTAAAAARREEVAAATALVGAAKAELDRARQGVERSASLSGEGECPVCGQALGDAFENVQAHRAAEAADAGRRHEALRSKLTELTAAAAACERDAAEAGRQTATGRQRLAEWEEAHRRRLDAEAALEQAWRAAVAGGVHPIGHPIGSLGGHETAPPAADVLALAVAEQRATLAAKREAQAEVLTIRGRLEGRDRLESSLASERDRLASASGRLENLREKVQALGFQKEALDEAAAARDRTAAAAQAATAAAQRMAITAARERERADGATRRLEEARAQHAKLAELETEARHRSRVADLLAEFRNTVVASVGPRLAVQAADLFGELTDHEYERIDVDPDTYQLQISDGGRLYGLDRFSGSEIDLANLALRVAISEHIHFESGGSVGLLVLDEVFGPLDEDRKARMLLALERLRGRFRQVLVVTHDHEIKEQLPNAIEVVKLPGRRATARVLGA